MGTNEQKATLDIQSRNFEVDMSQLLTPQKGKANLTMTEVKGCLTLPMKSKYFGCKKVPPKGDFTYEIKLTGSPDNKEELCEAYFSGSPITCKIQGCQQRDSKGTFHVETCNSELDLYFDSSKVIDCPRTLNVDQTFNLPFQIVISDDTSQFVIEDYFVITVKQFVPQLKFQFISDYSDENKLVYSETSWTEVGKLRVSHNASFSCAPDVMEQQVKLTCAVKDGSADGNVEVKERNDLLLMKGVNGKMEMTYIVKNLKPDSFVDIPIFFNVVEAGNPASNDNPNVYIPSIVKNKCEGSFKLYRNNLLTKKKVFFLLPNMEEKDGDITMLNYKDLGDLLLVQQADTDYTLTLTFMNEADATDSLHPNASVLVWDVAIDKVDYDPKYIQTRNGKTMEDIFKLSAESDRWALNPKRGKKCSLYIKLKAGDITSIMPHHNEKETFADITLHLKYHAKEDVDGKFYHQVMDYEAAKGEPRANNKGLHQCDLHIRLKKQPQSEWLCVDFGTSAVVAAYARNTLNDRESLIDLKSLKGHLLDKNYGKDSPLNSNSDEDDMLISSTACFHDDLDTIDYHNVDGHPESFMKYPVWFSPSAPDVKNDYLLPCLKTIIGYKHLPNIFTENALGAFKYRCDEGAPIGLRDKQGDFTQLMEVNEVAKIIYQQLFKYYLSNRLDRKKNRLIPRDVNKLVLSVPNTFTPLNIQTIKDLVLDSMPNIYPEFLHTISESDAVACYYVSHQNDFLNSLNDIEKKERLVKRESVLVYDMGAGTLDLTWFVKTTQYNEGGDAKHTDINIEGKLGVNKAGNYLDYELATILYELVKEKRGKSKGEDSNLSKLLLLDRNEFQSDVTDRQELKNYVKELKKMLSEDPDTAVPKLEIDKWVYIAGEQTEDGNSRRKQGVRLTVRDILENRHFQDVISEMTEKVLATFGKRYGDKEGKLDIDVLIFSGRSTSLRAIREGVRKYISDICLKPEELLYADLGEGKLNTDIQQPNAMDNSLLKTVVTQGALAFATMFSRADSDYQLHSKNYYASFGLIKYLTDRTFEYVPLIDDYRKTNVKEANGIIESEPYTVKTRNLTQVDLVQSYSSHEAADYTVGNFDTISKLCEIPCQGMPDFQVQLIMNIVKSGTVGTALTFKVGQGCNSLDPHDDFNNLSLRKSLWPVIFDNGENNNR